MDSFDPLRGLPAIRTGETQLQSDSKPLGGGHLGILPEDLLNLIFLHLNRLALIRCMCVCKRFTQIAQRSILTKLFVASNLRRLSIHHEDHSAFNTFASNARMVGVNFCNNVAHLEGSFVVCNKTTEATTSIPLKPCGRLLSQQGELLFFGYGHKLQIRDFKTLQLMVDLEANLALDLLLFDNDTQKTYLKDNSIIVSSEFLSERRFYTLSNHGTVALWEYDETYKVSCMKAVQLLKPEIFMNPTEARAVSVEAVKRCGNFLVFSIYSTDGTICYGTAVFNLTFALPHLESFRVVGNNSKQIITINAPQEITTYSINSDGTLKMNWGKTLNTYLIGVTEKHFVHQPKPLITKTDEEQQESVGYEVLDVVTGEKISEFLGPVINNEKIQHFVGDNLFIFFNSNLLSLTVYQLPTGKRVTTMDLAGTCPRDSTIVKFSYSNFELNLLYLSFDYDGYRTYNALQIALPLN